MSGGAKKGVPAAAAATDQERLQSLTELLSSIGQLSEHGEVPVYAFGTLISSAPPQAIAEHLHQRWLSDPHFAKIAPKLIFHMGGNVAVYSQVLSLALRDFNARHEIRAQNRGMFRNFVRTLVELYPVYRQIDKSLSACLVDPMFRCLQMLAEEGPDDKDLHCFANLVAEFGQRLGQLNPAECDRLVLACRRWLCSNGVPLEERTRQLLMRAIDLWTYSWDRKLFPDSLRRHYEQAEEQADRERRRQQGLLWTGRQYSSASTALPPPDQPHNGGPNVAGASSSSQLMSDSASSSLPSSALPLEPIKVLPSHSATPSAALPNGHSNLSRLTLHSGHRKERRKKNQNGLGPSPGENDGKESTI